MSESKLANQYQLLEALVSGSFGVVYKAIEKSTGEIVAIKHIDLETSEDDIQEIQGEINVLKTCASPFVTQYKTSFLRGSKLWIVMEFMGGGSCQDLVGIIMIVAKIIELTVSSLDLDRSAKVIWPSFVGNCS